MSKTRNKYSPEVRERAVRMVLDNDGQHESRWAAILSLSSNVGCAAQTLNEWVKRVEVDRGSRAGVPTEMAEKLKALERENRELRQRTRSCAKHLRVCPGRARPPVEAMIAFIDDHREEVPVLAPLVRAPLASDRADLQGAADRPSTYHDRLARRADPSDRARRDAELRPEVERVFEANFRVYGVRKVWRQMRREGFDVARCTVARLMKQMGIEGIVRGKKVRTTIPTRQRHARWTA